jgi:DNA repair protein RadC
MPPVNPTIHDLPNNERPRERLLQQGAKVVSNTELIAILLRTGTEQENALQLAQRLLSHFGGLHHLAQATPAELMNVRGLGSAKATQIAAALEIGNRLAASKPIERAQIKSAEDAAQLVMGYALPHTGKRAIDPTGHQQPRHGNSDNLRRHSQYICTSDLGNSA